VNPYNKSRSCGGSSGGDAGLIASRCALLSLATDSGGSIRIPCAFTGVHGFKPTAQRVGCKGDTGVQSSPLDVIKMSMGYIGRSAKDLALAFQVHSHPSITGLDPSLPRMPFNEEQFERGASGKIKVGYFDSFPFLSATDATKRAVSEAKQALESQGYELVPFNFTAEEVADLTEVSLTIGCDPDFFDTLKTVGDNYEPLMPCYTLSAFIT